ncbi:hypothetical protein J2X48_004090 [Bosea sp. BE271]|nr:hypothetical protein [Bosea robiniae]MDR6897138.1 hypothetical protein [Bosea sp. BE109]MDR7140535.1 hypothetical protein [Bosea sp. BE168]MDR7177144.1 hypothetical protein [Bosea sp. BE271]
MEDLKFSDAQKAFLPMQKCQRSTKPTAVIEGRKLQLPAIQKAASPP